VCAWLCIQSAIVASSVLASPAAGGWDGVRQMGAMITKCLIKCFNGILIDHDTSNVMLPC